MTKLVQRTKAPSRSDEFYGNKNPFSGGAFDMFDKHKGKQGNCAHYCYGRMSETIGKESKLPTGDADTWLASAKKKGYQTGSEPKIGAIICFIKTSNGHIGFIENILSNGDLVVSMSGWASYLFKTVTLTKKSGYKYLDYKVQGYIYSPIEFEQEKTIDKYTKGTYEVISPRYVRTGAGTEYSIKKVKDISADGKKHVVKTSSKADAQYKKGTRFTVYETKYSKNYAIWGRSPSGWICLESHSGTAYCKKVK